MENSWQKTIHSKVKAENSMTSPGNSVLLLQYNVQARDYRGGQRPDDKRL